jgi:hypothetical protein
MALDFAGNVFLGVSDGQSGKIVKFSPSGVQQWSNLYAPVPGSFTPSSIAIDNVDNAYFEGTRVTLDTNSHDYCTLEFSSSGAQVLLKSFKYSPNSINNPVSIQTDRQGDFIVTGISVNPPAVNYSIVTVKYGEITSVIHSSDNIPSGFRLFQNYPNPFNPVTSIKYYVPQESFVTLKIYDIIGNEVATLVNEEKNPGAYAVSFDAGDRASGIYVYSLRAGSYSETRKMILLK